MGESSRYGFGLLLILLAGCGSEFALPEGDVQRGREAFVALGCNGCHSVADIERVDTGRSPEIDKRLGSAVTRVKSYEDLLTSIINPSHRLSQDHGEAISEIAEADGRSRMPSYNDVMTVQQLVDLVTFLQPEYQVSLPSSDYPIYYP